MAATAQNPNIPALLTSFDSNPGCQLSRTNLDNIIFGWNVDSPAQKLPHALLATNVNEVFGHGTWEKYS